ncbi:hypothetical protein BD414DRAFT_495810 [Trametes punicea]|nr:hypothetical protein BD414DRAFT_495810 [Trametes punicea]
MPGLIQRYNAVAEYSALISTNSSSAHRRHARRAAGDTAPSTRASLSDEAADWYEAICPPLQEVQDVVRRIQADPDFSQERIFSFLAPIVVFSALFIVAVIAVQPHSFAHRILDAPKDHTEDIIKFAGILVGGVALSLVALKCIIWGLAELSTMIAALETRDNRSRREDEGIPTSNLVLGGMLMFT